MQRVFRVIVACFYLVFGVGAAYSEEMPGTNEPRFQAAISDWLEGEDKSSLGSFALLAREGNRAAQVFLGQIERRPWLHYHVTGSLSREERIALLRKDGGLSGKSWLEIAAVDTPLARELFEARKPYRDTRNAFALFSLGELSSAVPLIYTAWGRGGILDALEIALHPNAVKYSSGFVQPKIYHLPSMARMGWFSLDDPRLPRIQEKLHLVPAIDRVGAAMWGESERPRDIRDYVGQPEKLEEIGSLLLQVEELRPLVQYVRRYCPDDMAQVLGALQILEIDGPLTLLTLSPLETLIPSPDYVKSARFEPDLYRKFRHSEHHKIFLKRLNICANDMVFGLVK